MPKKQTRPKAQTRHRNRSRRSASPQFGQTFLVALLVLGTIVGGLYSLVPKDPRVLAYATNVSHSGLLVSTNQHRSANGLVQLTLNSQLNSAAQAKANDMVAKNYWSHTSPDGRQPWSFITAAGYSYSMAGENLAYGALTSESTVQAWMNSPGHRANILKSEFRHVGFGYANSANYQNSGPQTVIVAMYATPYAAPAPAPTQPAKPPAPKPAPKPPAPAPVQPAPAPAPAPTPAPVAQPSDTKTASAPKDTPAKKVADTTEKSEPAKSQEEDAQATQAARDGEEVVAPVADTQPVRRLSLVTGSYNGWLVGLVVFAGVFAAGLFLFRHSRAWHRRILKGEDFIVHHPVIDAVAVISVIIVIVLMQNVGHIL